MSQIVQHTEINEHLAEIVEKLILEHLFYSLSIAINSWTPGIFSNVLIVKCVWLVVLVLGTPEYWPTQLSQMDGLVQNCSISSALALEILQSCNKQLKYSVVITGQADMEMNNFLVAKIPKWSKRILGPVPCLVIPVGSWELQALVGCYSGNMNC